jgi:hypothetical protein
MIKIIIDKNAILITFQIINLSLIILYKFINITSTRIREILNEF